MAGRLRSEPGAVVVGADVRALGVVRSLGRKGIPVAVVRYDDDRIALRSRYATARHGTELPATDPERVDALLEFAARQRYHGWVLFATDDESSAMLSRHRDRLAATFRVTAPGWGVLSTVYDKRSMNTCAQACGIAVPVTASPRDQCDLNDLDIPFPVILKPAYKAKVDRLTAARAWRADDRASLVQLYDEVCRLGHRDSVMVQELLVGGGEQRYSYAALCSDGQPIASLVAQRLRQYPAEFGRHSTYVETVDDAEVEAAGQRFVNKIGYTGLLELEFHRDPRTGTLKLLDVNHRVWGWHSIGAPAGVDFPYLEWQLHAGSSVTRVRGKPGVRWRRATSDAVAIAQGVFGRTGTRPALRSLLPAAHGAVWAWDDPLPALLDLPLFAAKRVARSTRRGISATDAACS
jgi:predicted ATP-grasp superfamily ATP-dependent carboligase